MTSGIVNASFSLPEWQLSCKNDFLCTLVHVLLDFDHQQIFDTATPNTNHASNNKEL